MSIVQRVAQIINRSGHCDWRLEYCRAGQCQCAKLARDVISAMRECPDELQLAAFEEDGETEFAVAVWHTMIDEALK